MEEETKTITADIVPKLSKFLDRHLVYPLLEFLSSKEVSVVSVINPMIDQLTDDCCSNSFVFTIDLQ